MDKLHRDWFEQLQINFQQSPDGFIGIHAKGKDKHCVYFEVPYAWVEDDDFFGLVYEQAKIHWEENPKNMPAKCPVCNHAYMRFHFQYKGDKFCRWCGSHYVLDGARVIITRSILETRV